MLITKLQHKFHIGRMNTERLKQKFGIEDFQQQKKEDSQILLFLLFSVRSVMISLVAFSQLFHLFQPVGEPIIHILFILFVHIHGHCQGGNAIRLLEEIFFE